VSDSDASSASASTETEITLGVLNAVHEDSTVTQRTVSRQLGIALGLTNAYLKRCVKKGLIKVKQIPPNRYAYYLTPQGFSEKSRLTAEYLSSSLTFFRRARSQCAELFGHCAGEGFRRVALYGAGDLAEIATLCAGEFQIELAGIVDDATAGPTYAGLAVVPSLAEIGGVDAVLVTDMRDPQGAYDRLREALSDDRILTPALLRIVRGAAGAP